MALFIIFLIFGAAFSLLTHELSHLIVGKIHGWKLSEFKPWPHRFDNRWYFGRVSFFMPESERKNPFMHSAPLWNSFTLFLCFLCFAGFVHWSFFGLALWELIDYCWWWFGFLAQREGSDGKKMRDWLIAVRSD